MGGVEKKESSERSQSQSFTDSQKKGLSKALGVYSKTVGKGMDVYQGNRVADISPLQTQVFDFAKNGGFIKSPQQTQDYFQNVIKNPAIKNYSEITNPAIKEAFSGPGYWGSARATAEAKAGQDLADNLNTDWSKLNWDTQEANKKGALSQYGLGEAQRSIDQQKIAADMQKFEEEGLLTDPNNINILLSLLGMNYSTSSSKGSSSGWGANLGGALPGLRSGSTGFTEE